MNLSGGQKARLCFARALYHSDQCNLVLLDDPLSAVDVHIAKKMFDRGICKMLSGRTRVVVMSSHRNLATAADYIIQV